jgi:hypothetical protein
VEETTRASVQPQGGEQARPKGAVHHFQHSKGAWGTGRRRGGAPSQGTLKKVEEPRHPSARGWGRCDDPVPPQTQS